MGGLKPHRKDVLQAWGRIRPHVRKTPVLEIQGGMLKLENLQHTGAYKIRGACNALMLRYEQAPFKCAITASAGNHAAGLAYASKIIGVEAVAVVPLNTPEVKIINCRRMGCKVVKAGSDLRESMVLAKRMAEESGAIFLHPFDDPDVICGQGTIGLELESYAPEVVLVPIGGGGLASGLGLAFSHSNTKVIGVQVEGADVMNRTIRRLRPLKHVDAGLADGVNVRDVGTLTTELCSEYLDDILVVQHSEVVQTMKQLAVDYHLIAEAAGSIAATALTYVSKYRSIAVVSGGNVDLSILAGLHAEKTTLGAA